MADAPGLRPTPDRIRESLFNWLQPYINGANCLDLFAGSGVLGIEAVSRGAASSVLIEQNRKTGDSIREAINRLETSAITVQEADALQWIKNSTQVFDIIFLDPPFGQNLIEQSLTLLLNSACVGNQTLFYVESEKPYSPEINVEVIKQAKAGQVNYMLLKPAAN